MTRRATKETTAGRRYLDLQRKARRTGRPTDELIQLYALEGFLDRLTAEFSTVLGLVALFADPVIAAEGPLGTWNAVRRAGCLIDVPNAG